MIKTLVRSLVCKEFDHPKKMVDTTSLPPRIVDLHIPIFFYLEINALVVRLSSRIPQPFHTSTISVQNNANVENIKSCLPIGDPILDTCFGLRSYGSISKPSCLVGACQVTRKTGHGFPRLEGSLVEWQSRFDLTVCSPLETKEHTKDS